MRKKHKYTSNSKLISMLDDVYILAIISYLPLKHKILLEKAENKLKKAKAENKPKIISDLKIEIVSLNRKIKHYEKWRKYLFSLKDVGYDRKIRQVYVVANKIFEERLRIFKFSNYPQHVKDDAYILFIEQIYKYLFLSYRNNYKKKVWMYYNDYIKYEKITIEENNKKKNPSNLKYNKFGMLLKPNNNPFSYITGIVETSMLNNTREYKKAKQELIYFDVLTEYDVNYSESSNITEFEDKYIFNYKECDEDFYNSKDSNTDSDDFSFTKKSSEIEDSEDSNKNTMMDEIIESRIQEAMNESNSNESDSNDKPKRKKESDFKVNLRYYDYLSSIKEMEKYNIDEIVDYVNDTKFLIDSFNFINTLNIRNVDKEVATINTIFCKICNEYAVDQFIYYSLRAIDNDKLLEKVLKNVDESIVDNIYKSFL